MTEQTFHILFILVVVACWSTALFVCLICAGWSYERKQLLSEIDYLERKLDRERQ